MKGNDILWAVLVLVLLGLGLGFAYFLLKHVWIPRSDRWVAAHQAPFTFYKPPVAADSVARERELALFYLPLLKLKDCHRDVLARYNNDELKMDGKTKEELRDSWQQETSGSGQSKEEWTYWLDTYGPYQNLLAQRDRAKMAWRRGIIERGERRRRSEEKERSIAVECLHEWAANLGQ
jgi:hypothetical protein